MLGRKIFYLFFFLFFYSSSQQCSEELSKKEKIIVTVGIGFFVTYGMYKIRKYFARPIGDDNSLKTNKNKKNFDYSKLIEKINYNEKKDEDDSDDNAAGQLILFIEPENIDKRIFKTDSIEENALFIKKQKNHA